MKRRTVLVATVNTLALVALVAPIATLAQRPAQPIRRPLPPGRPNFPLTPGRFYPRTTTDSVAGVASPAGVFTVIEVNTRDKIVRLRDSGGASADVWVDDRMFDVSVLSAGDQVAVDFFVPDDGDQRLKAASIWKVEPFEP